MLADQFRYWSSWFSIDWVTITTLTLTHLLFNTQWVRIAIKDPLVHWSTVNQLLLCNNCFSYYHKKFSFLSIFVASSHYYIILNLESLKSHYKVNLASAPDERIQLISWSFGQFLSVGLHKPLPMPNNGQLTKQQQHNWTNELGAR